MTDKPKAAPFCAGGAGAAGDDAAISSVNPTLDLPHRQSRSMREICAPMLAVCKRNPWHAIAEALSDFCERWERHGG